jgi:hypothetical protein
VALDGKAGGLDHFKHGLMELRLGGVLHLYQSDDLFSIVVHIPLPYCLRLIIARQAPACSGKTLPVM